MRASAIPRYHCARNTLGCPNFTLLSPIERENRALAQITKERVHPGRPLSLGDALRPGTRLRRALQPRPLEQCHRLYHAEGYAGRTPAGDSGRPGSEIGSGERTPEESPPQGRVIDETDYFRVSRGSAQSVSVGLVHECVTASESTLTSHQSAILSGGIAGYSPERSRKMSLVRKTMFHRNVHYCRVCEF
jgi:hypothetical protein